MNHDLLTCPKCGETNPTKAIMCWACYTPLTEEARLAQERVKQDQQRRQQREARRQNFIGRSLLSLLLGGGAAFIASGYFERRRKELLSVGTLAALLLGVWIKRINTKDKRLSKDGSQQVVVDPIARYANEILRYGVQQNAAQIRFGTAYHGISVQYLVDDEWKNGAPLPPELWPELRAHFARISGYWQNVISVTMQGRPFFFTACFERDSLNDSLTLARQEVEDVAPPMALKSEGSEQSDG